MGDNTGTDASRGGADASRGGGDASRGGGMESKIFGMISKQVEKKLAHQFGGVCMPHAATDDEVLMTSSSHRCS